MAYNKNNQAKEKQYIKWGIIGVIIVLILAFGKTLLNKFAGGLALFGAKNTGKKIEDIMKEKDPNGVRLPFIRTVCETVKSEIDSWNQDEIQIVKVMNTLSNAAEAAAAAAYYQSAYGQSLRSELQEALNSDNWFQNAACHFSDLKDYIKNTIV